MRLEHSPSKTAGDILAKLNNGTVDEKVSALKKLSVLSLDITFALEFINKQGLALIISQVIFCLATIAVLRMEVKNCCFVHRLKVVNTKVMHWHSLFNLLWN